MRLLVSSKVSSRTTATCIEIRMAALIIDYRLSLGLNPNPVPSWYILLLDGKKGVARNLPVGALGQLLILFSHRFQKAWHLVFYWGYVAVFKLTRYRQNCVAESRELSFSSSSLAKGISISTNLSFIRSNLAKIFGVVENVEWDFVTWLFLLL